MHTAYSFFIRLLTAAICSYALVAPPVHAAELVGRVRCDGTDANPEQVRRGMAWVYDRYARPDSPLHALQDKAKATKAGLWVDAQPVEPWEWRKTK